MDPIQVLTNALSLPEDSQEQVLLFSQLREHLELQPGSIPVLCTTLLANVVASKDSAFKRWLLDLLHYGLSRSSLPIQGKTQLAVQTLDALSALMNDPSVAICKLTIQCFASAYPLVFRYICENRQNTTPWDVLSRAKHRILGILESPRTPAGVQIAAIKFVQRVILVQSRGVSDPRLQNKADPNIGLCPPNQTVLNPKELENEGVTLLQQLVGILYNHQNPEILTAVLNCFAPLVKLRPSLVPLVLTAATSWKPDHLVSLPASAVKSVEKAIRILLVHIMRHGYGAPHQQEINEALAVQQARMDQAVRDEQARRLEASRKRALPEPAEGPAVLKRPRTDNGSLESSAATAQSLLASFDFTTLPLDLVKELVIANLIAIDQVKLSAAVTAYRERSNMTAPTTAVVPQPAAAPAPPPPSRLNNSTALPVVKEEPLDPLKMELDEDEIEYEPDKLNSNLEGDAIDDEPAIEHDSALVPLQHLDFELPSAPILSDEERSVLVQAAFDRLRSQGDLSMASLELREPEGVPDASAVLVRLPATEAWILFVVRMATRGPTADVQPISEAGGVVVKTDRIGMSAYSIRKALCDYILADFASRSRLATIWMNEEWYNDVVRSEDDPGWERQFDIWIQTLLAAQKDKLDPKDKAFSRFLVDLPSLPSNLLSLLRDLCLDPEIMPIGFSSLRELVTLRPPVRTEALQILLDLTTHPDKVIRGAAIITVRRWVPDQQPMNQVIRAYAGGMLQRLATSRAVSGSEHQDPISSSSYLPKELIIPASKSVVLQHVELLLGLAVKLPEFLDQIFDTYGQMDVSVQEALKSLLVPLIKTLGPSNPKLLELLQTFRPDAETLALRVLTIFTENARPTPAIVSLAKDLIAERDVDPAFLVLVIAEMDKADVLKYLPRLVSTLTGKAEDRDSVRRVFTNIVADAPSGTSSNMPRQRQSERLAPSELMVMLHEQEKEIGLKSAMEAIAICFAMPDVFRSETLGVVMQQIMDEPTLPMLFMRTVIQAVTTYKNLVSFVTTTLFSRLIVKKIWANGPLWEGFIRCAKATAPSSFGALLQLPKDQLREVVDKQPSLRSGLRDYVIKKERSKPKLASFLETLGDGGEGAMLAETPSGTPPPAPMVPPIGNE